MDETTLTAATAHPALIALREALGDVRAYLVGGSVRDLLLGRPLTDLDVAVDGDLEIVLERVGVEARSHERFGTASVTLEGTELDLARTRRERYRRPGALPEVEPAPIRTDLARRDFTANAIALPLTDRREVELIDPYDGVADIEAGLLRAIHRGSFIDDPTRALRAARYAARLDFSLEPATALLLEATDLGTVSGDRVRAELLRIAAGPAAVRGFELLSDWGLLPLAPGRLDLLRAAESVVGSDPWHGLIDRPELLAEIAATDEQRLARVDALVALEPSAPSAGFAAARVFPDSDLAIARAMGASWLDLHVGEWRRLELSIDGEDLLAAGVPEGPEVGRALEAVRAARLDGLIAADAGAELELALATIAREPEQGGNGDALA